ncbi:MAG: ABA4-like family protein [Variovorax sp.]
MNVDTVHALPLDAMFSLANASALLAWVALIALPRWVLLRRAILALVVLGLCLLYTVLIQVYFFRVPGGGFGTLGEVQQLFTLREVALAGWVHYLAFDLFVGLWIARRADRMGLSRWLQAPVLATTFMFGPIGLLMFSAALGVSGWQRRRKVTAAAVSGITA